MTEGDVKLVAEYILQGLKDLPIRAVTIKKNMLVLRSEPWYCTVHWMSDFQCEISISDLRSDVRGVIPAPFLEQTIAAADVGLHLVSVLRSLDPSDTLPEPSDTLPENVE